MSARDPITGKVTWTKRMDVPPHASLLSTAGGLLFVPGAEGTLRAWDAKTGNELWTHEDGGRRPGKGPQLMGTPLTDEEVFNRIKFGKPGRMAGFGGPFGDDQIKLIVVYIRNLKPRP